MATQDQLERLLAQWISVWDTIEESIGIDPLHERIEFLQETSEEALTDAITYDDLERHINRLDQYFHRRD